MDEPTAIHHGIRYPGSTRTHQPLLLGEAVIIPACWGPGRGEPQFVPLSQTAPEDHCKACWPTK